MLLHPNPSPFYHQTDKWRNTRILEGRGHPKKKLDSVHETPGKEKKKESQKSERITPYTCISYLMVSTPPIRLMFPALTNGDFGKTISGKGRPNGNQRRG